MMERLLKLSLGCVAIFVVACLVHAVYFADIHPISLLEERPATWRLQLVFSLTSVEYAAGLVAVIAFGYLTAIGVSRLWRRLSWR